MKRMKDYHDWYLKCDVLLLAGVFKKIKNSSFKNYTLWPSHYLTTLSWDALFDMTKVELALVSDADMYLFFEKGMRDGVSRICKSFSIANNKYLKLSDLTQESKHIYLDVNNLHGCALSKFLPTGGFKSIDTQEVDLNKSSSNSLKVCVLEVDLECPNELCELYNDYPLALDKIEIIEEMLSSYQFNIDDIYNISIGNVKKLVLKFFDKKSMCFTTRTCIFI